MSPVAINPPPALLTSPKRPGVGGRLTRVATLTGLVIMTTLAAGSDAPSNLWQPAASLPLGVAGFARGVVNGKILVAGGTAWEAGTKFLPESVWQYAPDSDRWTEAGRLSRAFAFGVSATRGSALILLGGDDGTKTRADARVFAIDGEKHPAPALPRPVAYAGFTSNSDGPWFVLGGTPTMSDLASMHASFLRFDPDSGHTVFLPDFPGGPVIHAALAVANDCVYAFPGGVPGTAEGGIRNTRAAWRYVISSGQWQPIAPYPFAVRGLATKALDERFILLAGGFKTTPDGRTEITGDCHLYDMRSDTYLALPALPHPAMLIGLELLDGYVYAFGGEDRPRHRSARMFRAAVPHLITLGEGSPMSTKSSPIP